MGGEGSGAEREKWKKRKKEEWRGGKKGSREDVVEVKGREGEEIEKEGDRVDGTPLKLLPQVGVKQKAREREEVRVIRIPKGLNLYVL